jgi:hypothetical protein
MITETKTIEIHKRTEDKEATGNRETTITTIKEEVATKATKTNMETNIRMTDSIMATKGSTRIIIKSKIIIKITMGIWLITTQIHIAEIMKENIVIMVQKTT